MSENVNVPLLRKAVEWAEAEAAKPPELCEWNQGLYVLPRDADDYVWAGSSTTLGQGWIDRERKALGKAADCGTCYCIAGYIAHLSGRPWHYDTADEIAAEELGLNNEGRRLFDAFNSIEDVRRIAEEIAGERL